MNRTPIGFKPRVPNYEVAGSRLRCYLPAYHLREAGWDCSIFQPDRWREYGTVIFQKTYDEQEQALARRLRANGARVIFDLCDNHLYVPPDSPELQPRADQLRRMLDLCDDITVSTAELGKAIGRPTHVVDDALEYVSPERFDLVRAAQRFCDRWRRPRLRLIWFGNWGMESPPFGMIDLAPLVPELNELNRSAPIHLMVVSNSREVYQRYLGGARFPTSYREFATRTFQKICRRADVCLVPVNPNPFTLCKTVNRPAMALLLGIAVVADAIPSYEELRPYICIGNWRENLTRHAADPGLRRRQIADGQAFLYSRYTAAHVVQQWSAVLAPAAALRRAG